MPWIKISERLPDIGVLVYVKDKDGKLFAATRYLSGWYSMLSDSLVCQWYQVGEFDMPAPDLRNKGDAQTWVFNTISKGDI